MKRMMREYIRSTADGEYVQRVLCRKCCLGNRAAGRPGDSCICLPNTGPVALRGIPASGIKFCATTQTSASLWATFAS